MEPDGLAVEEAAGEAEAASRQSSVQCVMGMDTIRRRATLCVRFAFGMMLTIAIRGSTRAVLTSLWDGIRRQVGTGGIRGCVD